MMKTRGTLALTELGVRDQPLNVGAYGQSKILVVL
jgi:hypothetical protein